MSDRIRITALVALLLLGGPRAMVFRAESCEPVWDPALGQVGEPAGLSGPVNALVVFDDGTGPALYAGGLFVQAGGVTVNNVAKWNGTSWSALGSGTNSVVYALAVYDDGDGPALYAAGFFDEVGGVDANRIAKWDGESWEALTTGVNSAVTSLAVFDGALYAGGQFTIAGGAGANRIAQWDGSTWTALLNGLNNIVSTLAGTDEASAVGPALYVGGNFTTAGGSTAQRIAAWDGDSWSALAGGGMNAQVLALTILDDGSGPVLCAGGKFTTAGGGGANRVAAWDGSGWAPLGQGMNDTVLALAVFEDASGPALYAGGEFTMADGLPATHIAKWDGLNWSALDNGTNGDVLALGVSSEAAVIDAGLYVGGSFTEAGGVAVNRVARWGCTRGDCNGNGYVDLDDFAEFHGCITGVDGGPLPFDCWCADFDLDDDVDLKDWAKFQVAFTGAP